MAIEGDLIADYITNKISVVTTNFINRMGRDAPSPSLMSTFKINWQKAIAEGLYEYVSNQYEFDVKTNGLITLTPPPPGATLAVTNYAVDGNIIVIASDILAKLFLDNLTSTCTDAVTNMTIIFDNILTWLPKVVNVTESVMDITINPLNYLSTITGIGTILFPNFIPQTLAQQCVQETSALTFVNSQGVVEKKYTDVWKIIGKYIYRGLNGNIITTVDIGAANTTIVPNGISYAGVSTGTVNFN